MVRGTLEGDAELFLKVEEQGEMAGSALRRGGRINNV